MKKVLLIILLSLLSGCGEESSGEVKNFLNISYDSTREFYAEYSHLKR